MSRLLHDGIQICRLDRQRHFPVYRELLCQPLWQRLQERQVEVEVKDCRERPVAQFSEPERGEEYRVMSSRSYFRTRRKFIGKLLLPSSICY